MVGRVVVVIPILVSGAMGVAVGVGVLGYVPLVLPRGWVSVFVVVIVHTVHAFPFGSR
jgi:hypothetical protein